MVLSGTGFSSFSVGSKGLKRPDIAKEILRTTTAKDGLDILFYTGYHDEIAPTFTVQCPQKCNIINDKSRINSSDAVLFHIPNVNSINEMPTYHNPNQKWIFFTMEPPLMKDRDRFKEFNNRFNVTMTYRKESDVFVPFAKLVPISPGDKADATDITDREPPGVDKTKLVAWFTRTCELDSKADQYVKIMQHITTTEVFGECGSKNCAEGNYLSACLRELNTTYKFYLSFEGSLCKDYISENLWSVFGYNMVPVVLGQGDYAGILPEKSYIDIKNFQSPKELVRFMMKLHRNFDMYKEYFDWKEKYKVQIEDREQTFCRLCNHLYATTNHGAVIDNIQEWWYDCVEPKTFYKNSATLLTKWYAILL